MNDRPPGVFVPAQPDRDASGGAASSAPHRWCDSAAGQSSSCTDGGRTLRCPMKSIWLSLDQARRIAVSASCSPTTVQPGSSTRWANSGPFSSIRAPPSPRAQIWSPGAATARHTWSPRSRPSGRCSNTVGSFGRWRTWMQVNVRSGDTCSTNSKTTVRCAPVTSTIAASSPGHQRQRLFDVARRVYPDDVEVIDPADARRERERRFLRSLGISRDRLAG